MSNHPNHQNWVIDLDGVVWRGHKPVPGSAAAIDRLQQAGKTVIFATNNAASTPETFEQRLNSHGIKGLGNVVSSAMATATLVGEGERLYVIGGEGVRNAVSEAGAIVVDGNDPATVDTVAVGIDRTFNYDMLRTATRAILAGARLLAANTDSSFPGADGIDPGNGSLVAAIETASGATAQVAGKPHEAMAALVRERWGTEGVCVGDRPETDGDFAVTLGYDFALVLSGVTTEADLPVTPTPQYTAADLAALVSSS